MPARLCKLLGHAWIDMANVKHGGPIESGHWCSRCGKIKP